jgi:hypothetical protein
MNWKGLCADWWDQGGGKEIAQPFACCRILVVFV